MSCLPRIRKGLSRFAAIAIAIGCVVICVDRVAGGLGGPAYGITVVTDDDDRAPLAALLRETAATGVPESVVVLVHGLDDPGWMWRDVIPAMRGAGHVVVRMEYPNDGPIRFSADLFAGELAKLKAAGVRRVTIVAHSMGGLVSRDVLTRRTYYAGDGGGGAADGRFPAVDRLIMCGTPNHGSELVRLRGVSELKEHLSRVFSGEGAWLGSLADGRGEAARDLLPGSRFLDDLNKRSNPTHTGLTIIAGRMSPVDEDAIDGLTQKVQDAAKSSGAPKWLQDMLRAADGKANELVRGAVRGIGDGCVTLDSARLDGVDDFVVVEANHVGMIVEIIDIEDETPPAIPVILDRLDGDAGG